MSLKKYLTVRVIILIFFLLGSILAISPNPFAKGVAVKTVERNSEIYNEGLRANDKILAINNKPVSSVEEFNSEIEKIFDLDPKPIKVETDKGIKIYNYLLSPGFKSINLTVTSAEEFTNMSKGELIKKINGNEIKDQKELDKIFKNLTETVRLSLETNKKGIVYLATEKPKFKVSYAKTTNLKKGLDLEGGTRVLLKPIKTTGEVVTDREVDDLIKVLNNRLDVYGLSDLKIRPAKSFLSDDKFVLIEIGGVTREEVADLIGKQGKFEAKIGDEIVFSGGKKDITFVCRNDGSCSGITPPQRQDANAYFTRFQFQIKLSPDAAKKQGQISKNLAVNASEDGGYLSKTLDLYLDGELIDSLRISKDLKGNEKATDILISGPGNGRTQEESGKEALKAMEKLQTILITGSLPVDIQIIKLDSISPIAGEAFLKNAIIIGFLALVCVALVLFLRYRKIKISLLILSTSVYEIIIILGFAALIGWSLDLAAIAGMIAAIGTGVDSQIVIVDEIQRGEARQLNWKQRIKNAFFIIFAAYSTVVAAMIPLFNAGAGLVRGFAITTIIGVSIGVFITRPAFSSFMEKLSGD